MAGLMALASALVLAPAPILALIRGRVRAADLLGGGGWQAFFRDKPVSPFAGFKHNSVPAEAP